MNNFFDCLKYSSYGLRFHNSHYNSLIPVSISPSNLGRSPRYDRWQRLSVLLRFRRLDSELRITTQYPNIPNFSVPLRPENRILFYNTLAQKTQQCNSYQYVSNTLRNYTAVREAFEHLVFYIVSTVCFKSFKRNFQFFLLANCKTKRF